MAVPKKRTSSARRDKRRANHKAATPRLNSCPRCHSPRLPHRVCPTCGTYAGREVITHKVAETPVAPPTDSE
jgi:large subunit ribosomal protein L32